MTEFSASMLAQLERMTDWFTTTWMISVGVLAGAVFVLLYLLTVVVISRIGGLNRIGESRTGLWIAGMLTGGVLAGLVCWWIVWVRVFDRVSGSLTEKLLDRPGYGDGYLTVIFPAAICLFLGFGHWMMVSRKRAPEVWSGVREGFLGWVNWVVGGLSLFALLGYGLFLVDGFGIAKFVADPNALLHSLSRIPAARDHVVTIDDLAPTGATEAGYRIEVNFPGLEFRGMEVASNQELEIASLPFTNPLPTNQMYSVPSTSAETPRFFGRDNVIPEGTVTELYVANRGRNNAEVKIRYFIRPVYAEVLVIPVTAVATFLLYLIHMSFSALFPKISAISLSTFKTEVNQPVFYLVMAAGLAFVTISIFLPYNTLGEDIKMYKDGGLTLIRVLAIFVAIWASSKSVAEEIEGRTALTVLSKPVGRRQFILGKISGITLVIALMFVVLGMWLVFWTGFKPLYDAIETSRGDIEWAECFNESTSVIPALCLAFLESFLFVALSVMISTRLGILPNLVICFSIYILGHMTPLLVMSSTVVNAFEPVVFFGQLIAIVFPVLDNFNVEAAIMTNEVVPISYMLLSLLYTLLYGSIAILLSLVFFEDRDLA